MGQLSLTFGRTLLLKLSLRGRSDGCIQKEKQTNKPNKKTTTQQQRSWGEGFSFAISPLLLGVCSHPKRFVGGGTIKATTKKQQQSPMIKTQQHPVPETTQTTTNKRLGWGGGGGGYQTTQPHTYSYQTHSNLIPDSLHCVLALHEKRLVHLHLLVGLPCPGQLSLHQLQLHQAHAKTLTAHGHLLPQPRHLRQ